MAECGGCRGGTWEGSRSSEACRTGKDLSGLLLVPPSSTPPGGRRIAHAHSARPGALDRGPLAKKPSARKSEQHGGNIAPKWLQNCSKMAPTWLPNGLWKPLGGLLEVSWSLKKAWSAKGGLPGAYGARLDASWDALGAEKSSLERLLAAPRGIPREVSAILGPKRVPKGRPRGSKIESKRRLQLKT